MPKEIVDSVFLLEGVQLLHRLSMDDLSATTEGPAGSGEFISRECDPGDSMYVIISGEVLERAGWRASSQTSIGGPPVPLHG